MAPTPRVHVDPLKASSEQQQYTDYFMRHPDAARQAAPGPEAEAPNLLRQMWNDTGNAERFACLYGSVTRYCYPFNGWLNFDGRRWALDDDGAAELKAEMTMLEFMNQAAQAK